MPRQIGSPNGVQVERRWPEQRSDVAYPSYSPSYSSEPLEPGDAVGLNEITTPLWRRKGTIALVAIGGLILGGVVSFWLPTIYRARTSVQLEAFTNDMTAVSASLPNSSPENYLQNQVKVLESDTLAKRVADALNLQVGPPSALGRFVSQVKAQLGLQTAGSSEDEQRIKRVKDALTVRTTLQSQVIDVFYDSSDPAMAAKGANASIAAFAELNREAREALVKDTTDWLNKQAAELRASIAASNQHLQAFARANGLILAGNEGTLAQERARQTQEALAKAEAERAEKQSAFETASKNSLLFQDGQTPGPLRQYETDLATMRRQLAQLKALYTPTNYKVEQLQAQIAETEQAMEQERKDTVARMGNEYAASSRLETLLAEQQARQMKIAQEEMANDREYSTLKSEIDTTQKVYENVLEKAKEAGAASALRSTNIRLIDAATIPSIPYSPKTSLNMAIGLALGTLGGIGLVLLTERSDKVRRPGEVRIIDVPELGVIPSARDARALDYPTASLVKFKRSNGDVGLVTRDYGTSIMSDSFRGALTSILFGADGAREAGSTGSLGGRVLVIASVDMMEGKTTVLTNLGVVAAERKQKVLLIDADFRKPRLHEFFDLPNERGLTDILGGAHTTVTMEKLSLESLIQPTTTPGLSVLTTGPVDMASTALLLSTDLHAFIERCRNDYDLVLIDTPPLMLYTDARVLGRLSDGLVMVVRANKRSAEELRATYGRLREDQIPVLGTILNDWKMDPNQTRAYARYRDHYQRHSG